MSHEPINYYDILIQAPLNEAGVGRYLRSVFKILTLGSRAKFTPATDERPLLQAEAIFAKCIPWMKRMKALPLAFAFIFCGCFFVAGLSCHLRVCSEKNGFHMMDDRRQHELAQKCLIGLYLMSAKHFPWKGGTATAKATAKAG